MRDCTAQSILDMCHTKDKAPIEVAANGSCLFNAISKALVGHENLATELRTRTAVEMVKQSDWYRKQHKDDQVNLVSPDYTDAVVDCAGGGYSSAWTLHAAATVIQRPIVSMYPPLNGLGDNCVRILNCTFQPRLSAGKKEAIHILWSSLEMPREGHIWTPCHFVPLLQEPVLTVTLVHQDEPEEWPELPVKQSNSVTPEPKHIAKRRLDYSNTPTTSTQPSESHAAPEEEPKRESPISGNTDLLRSTPKTLPPNSPLNNSPPDLLCDLSTFPKTPPLTDTSTDSYEGSDAANTPPSDTHLDTTTESKGTQLPSNKFMEPIDAIKTLLNAKSVVDSIPVGKKDNVYLILQNEDNIQRRKCGVHSQFADDSGSWRKQCGSTPVAYYTWIDGKMMSVVLKNGQYCLKRQENKCKVYKPLTPQPAEDMILQMHRYYCVLDNSNYKRRITWMAKIPHIPFDVDADTAVKACGLALVEYLGIHPGAVPHGNAKEPDAPDYIRTKPSVLRDIAVKVKEGKRAADIYSEMQPESVSDDDDPTARVRDVRQVRNKKYAMDGAKKAGHNAKGAKQFRNTFADHVMEVSNRVHDRPQFVRDTHLHAKVPSVILFTDMQIALTKQMCCGAENPSVLGIDRTFNMSDVYVTVTSFKHKGLLRKSTSEHPILIGPILLHGSATWEVYSRFLTTVGDAFGTRKQPNLVIGSDDEKALRRAISESFTLSTNALCTRHLRKNVDDYLQNKVGLQEPDRAKVTKALFGPRGAVAAEDDDTFELRIKAVEELMETLTPNANRFNMDYMRGNRNLIQLLREGVVEPNLNHGLGSDWTNNNSESANHVLKSAIQWKQQSLPDLVSTLEKLIKRQETDIARSLIGTGEFKLAPSHQCYGVPWKRWCSMDAAERRKKIWNFIQDKRPRSTKNISCSTNGELVVPTTPSGGKKPCQRKRKRTERTWSAKKVRLDN